MSNDIYTYIESNFGIKITDYQFKRDYIKEPLKQFLDKKGKPFEKPFKEDLEYLYIKCNLSILSISKIFKVCKDNIFKNLKNYNIQKEEEIFFDKELYKIFNINLLKLKRNYIEEPLNNDKSKNFNEKPFKEDLEYLYLELNLSVEEITKCFGWSRDRIYYWIKLYKIIKPKELCVKHMEKTNLEKYGDRYCVKNNKVKKKIKQTKLEKYGDENYINIDKIKQTNLEKYGVDCYTKTEYFKNNYRKKYDSLSIEEKNELSIKGRRQFIKDEQIVQKLSNKDLFIDEIIKNNLNNTQKLCDYFGINRSNMNKLIRKYNVRYLLKNNFTEIETFLIEYLQNNFELEVNNRKYLDGKEIDIFIPKLNIGIEINGNYWHCEYGKDKNYHQNKSLLAQEKGIFIYHIFEYEWNTKREQIINQLNNLLGINQEKIYARKCIIKEVSNKEKKLFLEKNHLQGNDSSSIKLGLFYNDELVSIMTFVKPRFNKKYEWELSRFCSLNNCNVIGGASKLFKYFVDNYNPTSIISYSNIAHTRGKLYGLLGFELKEISEPNYVWYRSKTILTRYQCQKHKLLKQGYEGNSEIEIMHNRGYYRIYDCGNKVWVWNR